MKEDILRNMTEDMRPVVKEFKGKYVKEGLAKISGVELRLDIILNLTKALKEFIPELWNAILEERDLENLIMQFVSAFELGSEHRFEYEGVFNPESDLEIGCVIPLAQYMIQPLVEVTVPPDHVSKTNVIFIFKIYTRC